MKIEVYSPTIRRKEMDAVLTALVEDQIGPGEQAKLLIQIAREKLGFDYCVALRSPALALFFALKALGLEEGQGVVISALSPLYYIHVLNELKLKTIFADVASTGAVMNRETVERAIKTTAGAGLLLDSSEKNCDIRAIILHHTLGYLPDSVSIAELGIPLIEDCSQSYGTSRGNAGVFTILGLEERDMLTSGGGALLYAHNRRDASVLRNLLFPGGPGDLPPEYGLPDMNAAMGVVQFRGAAKNLERRREIASAYIRAAQRTRHKCFIQEIPVVIDNSENQEAPAETGADYNNYAFSLILESGMKDVKAYARRKDIIVESAFEQTLAGTGIVPAEICPEAYSLSLRTALFPLYPRLRGEEIEKVSKLIVTLP